MIAATSSHLRFACLGTYPPRKCGIATFSSDLCQAICRELKEEEGCQFIAVDDTPQGYAYPERVRFELRQEQLADYKLAADFMNVRDIDLLLVQHEYGIFGGEYGSHLLGMLRDVRVPIVTTMHTVLADAPEPMKKVTVELIGLSDRIVVMAKRAVEILKDQYDIPPERITMIPHGVPDVPFVDPSFYKDQFGVEGRKVLLTFGLLSPGKGIEYAIGALPELVRHHPDLIYIVLGATHPHIIKHRGEEYRHELQHMAHQLGVLEHIMFLNRYVDLKELCKFLGAADIYVTPYLGEDQIVSGTLAYALGAGNAVVSTPYWYAQEMLADGRGKLVPFRDSGAITREVAWLLEHETERQAMRKQAYLFTRQAVWRQVARSYLDVFRSVRRHPVVLRQSYPHPPAATSVLHAVPELNLDHVRRLTDDVGILQHARYTIANRDQGYTTDDNGRALIFALEAQQLTLAPETLDLVDVYLSFVHHAFDVGAARFRNLLSYDRRWIDEKGSEDCHGRALWGLGFAVALAPREGMRAAAMELFGQALPAVLDFTSPRAWAYTLVGIHAYLRRYSGDSDARRVRETLALRLLDLYQNNRADDWVWPEDQLTYDNGKLPHALILSGQWMNHGEMTQTGLKSLKWLMEVQTDPSGVLAPVGNQGWHRRGETKAAFDQQPIEAHGLLEACLEAYNATQDVVWVVEARRSFDWFLGKNKLNKPLYDYATGGCRDGLHREGVNANEGAESTLAWLLSLMAIRSLAPECLRPAPRTAPSPTDENRRKAGTRSTRPANDVDNHYAQPTPSPARASPI